MSEILCYEVVGSVARVTLNRPSVLNALNIDLFKEIRRAMDLAGKNDAVRVVTVHGAGRAWCAGGDLAEVRGILQRRDLTEIREFIAGGLATFESIRALPKPVIAVVHGDCIGGGNELNAACDFTIAGETARFGQAGPRIGSVPIVIHQTLALQIGDKRAREVTMLCKPYPARECLEMGWINRVVAPQDLQAAADEWCSELSKKNPQAIAISKHMHNHFYRLGAGATQELAEMLAQLWYSSATLEGVNAFLEKRAPSWTK